MKATESLLSQPSKLSGLTAWLPVVLFPAAIAGLWAAHSRASYESSVLLGTLNFVFATVASLLIAYLVGRSFLSRSRPGLLLLGCGVLAWGAGNVISVFALPHDYNTNVTVFNLTAWLSAVCHLAGVLVSLRLRSPIRAAGLWLASAYTFALAAVALAGYCAFSRWTPTFFIQGQGGTPVRQVVLGSAVLMFVASALVLRMMNRGTVSPFLHWYSLALLLIAEGLFGVLVQTSFHSALGWTGRASQYLGGVYMLVAAIVSVRDSKGWEISLQTALTEARKQFDYLFDLAADGILVHEMAEDAGLGKFTQANPAACTLLGYAPAEMKGLTPLKILAPEDHAVLAHDREVLLREGVLRHEKTLVAKNGRRIPAEINTRAFQDQRRVMVMSVLRDITERKRLEEQLRQRLEELQTVMEVAPVAIWVSHDPQCNQIVGNRAGDRFYEAVGGENVSANVSAVRRFFQNGRELSAAELPMQRAAALNEDVRGSELEVLLPSGKRITMIGNGSPLRDSEGRVRGCVGTFLDITARQRAEQELAAQEERLRVALEAGRMGTWDWHIPSGKAVWNPEHYRILGYEPGTVRPTYEAWATRLHPEDAAGIEGKLREALEQGGHYTGEFRILRPDGTVRWVEARGRFERDAEGRPLRSYGVVLDTTEHREADERIRHYNAILEARNRILHEALTSETEEELGRRCLAVLEELTGSRLGFIGEIGAQGLLSIAISDLGRDEWRLASSGESRAPANFKIQGLCGKVLRDGKGFYTNDPASHPDHIGMPEGHPPLTAFLGVPLQQGGETIGMIGVANRDGGYRNEDVEALEAAGVEFVHALMRKRAERALRAGEERLRQAQKFESIGLLAGGIAHDFNNLLVGIIGNASLAEDMLPYGSEVAEILRRIIKSGEQAAHLTRQLLAYAGKGRFVVGPVNLSGVVADGSALIRGSISKKIEIRLDLDPGITAVESDPSQMQQIFMNLALNAGEAIGAASGAISVSTGEIQVDAAYIQRELSDWPIEPGRFAFLDVRDTGCGMDERTRTRIFDPFFTTKFQGRGLGLAAVAGIVRAHRGAIGVTTAPGAGSTFRVLLPAAGYRAAAVMPPAERRADLRGKGTILIVDDEKAVRDLARRALEMLGYDVLVAETGLEAIETLRTRRNRIDLVVLDFSMPGMSGEEVLPQLRRIQPDLEVMISSGFSEGEALRVFRGTRVSGFIQKPYTTRQLAAEVKAALAEHPL